MKVVYLGRPSRRTKPSPALDGDVIELLSNNWDDYGYETTFPVTCRINGEVIDLDLVRLLIDGEQTTSRTLNRLRTEGWDGVFPIPETNYVSMPSDITFYEQLEARLDTAGVIEIAKLLRDASYLVRIAEDEAAKVLVESEGFRKSLQRERGSVKAYIDGWRIFERQSIDVLDLGFKFQNIFGNTTTLNLKFKSPSRLPHDINVLIGPNGYGKSRVIHQIVQNWISPSDDHMLGFVEKPNLSQIVVVSYSPFERFPVDLSESKFQDNDAYRYFGFRGRGASSDKSRRGSIRLSHEFPRKNAAHSLVSCLRDDKKYRLIRDWSRKVETVEQVLKTAIDFDFATVEISDKTRVRALYSDTSFIEPLSFIVEANDSYRQFVPVTSDRIGELDDKLLSNDLISSSGVTFFRDGDPIELSSGQRLFAYIVINILGAIRRNSLILIDEPELFLHPTLEIQFVDMLKKILTRFNSKALLATHSVVTVREVPADCVHVFEKTEDDLLLKNPPFQTFGGDFQRISSYVFGDKAVSKPFENWIRSQLEEFGSADDLISALHEELNEEMIVQIKAMERDQW